MDHSIALSSVIIPSTAPLEDIRGTSAVDMDPHCIVWFQYPQHWCEAVEMATLQHGAWLCLWWWCNKNIQKKIDQKNSAH